jgi:Skp family chaperone for outer membrane proteins
MGVPFPDRRPLVLTGRLPAAALALGIALVAFVAAPASAADIAIVDYQTIFERYEGTADAQRTLDRELKDWDTEAQEKRERIQELTKEIDSQRLMLSEERLREKNDELARLKDEYQDFAEDIWGVDGTAARRNAELTAPIAEKILDVIARIGDEKNLDVILDASTGGVVWAKDDINLTQTVLDDLSLLVKDEAEEGDTEEPSEAPAEGDDESGDSE